MAATGGVRVEVMRSQLGRVRGLGAAKHGVTHWWVLRLTSVALVPLTLWFIYAALSLTGADRAAVAHWASRPFNTVLLLCLIAATFHHMQLGVQVVIEDYVHGEAMRLISLLLVKAAAVVLALACFVAVLKLAF